MKKETVKMIPLPTFTDSRGSLTSVDFSQVAPFPIQRVFYVYDVPKGIIRGDHATYSPQFLICVTGGCMIRIHDGKSESTVKLTSRKEGLYLPPYTWRSLYDFTDNCVLLCLSDRPYNPADYINDFSVFLKGRQK